jgi:site-specific DNA recombinase
MPPPARLREVADHIDLIIESGTQVQRKALVEALVAQVKITGPGRVVPTSRIRQPQAGPSSKHSVFVH